MGLKFLKNTEIAIVSNIISSELADTLNNYAIRIKKENITQEDLAFKDPQDFKGDADLYSEVDKESVRDFWREKNVYLYEDHKEAVNEIKEALSNAFDLYLKTLKINKSYKKFELETGVIHVYREGHSLELHTDCHDYAFVLYLTDPSEYRGGELRYTDLDIEIRPEKASLLIAPSELYHEVLPVTEGYRCSMTVFIPVFD